MRAVPGIQRLAAERRGFTEVPETNCVCLHVHVLRKHSGWSVSTETVGSDRLRVVAADDHGTGGRA